MNKTGKFLVFAIFFLAYGYSLFQYKIKQRSFEAFFAGEIIGRLKSSEFRGHRDYLCLYQDSNRYYSVYMIEAKSAKPKWFSEVAHSGDSIVKHKFSDTLTLFTENGIHYFFIDSAVQNK